jgi:hypothetical protein
MPLIFSLSPNNNKKQIQHQPHQPHRHSGNRHIETAAMENQDGGMGVGDGVGVEYRETVADRCQKLTSIGEVKSFLDGIPEENQYSAQIQVMERIMRRHERSRELIKEVFYHVEKSGAYQRHLTNTEFAEAWEGVHEVIREKEAPRNTAPRNRLSEATEATMRRWPGTQAKAWVTTSGRKTAFIASCRQLAGSMGFGEAKTRVNAAVVKRLSTPRRGISNQKAVVTGDLNQARKTCSEEVEAIPWSKLKEFGLKIGESGFVKEGETRELEFDTDLVADENCQRQ